MISPALLTNDIVWDIIYNMSLNQRRKSRPDDPKRERPGGRLLLRLPQELHKDLAARAATEGVSVNQYVLAQIARSLGGEAVTHRLRAEAIRELYVKTVAAERAFSALLSPGSLPGGPSKEQLAKEATEAANAFRDAFFNNRIYLPKATVDRLAEIDQLIQRLFIQYNVHGRLESREDTEAIFNAWQVANGPLSTSRSRLEDDFRRLLLFAE